MKQSHTFQVGDIVAIDDDGRIGMIDDVGPHSAQVMLVTVNSDAAHWGSSAGIDYKRLHRATARQMRRVFELTIREQVRLSRENWRLSDFKRDVRSVLLQVIPELERAS
jgi:hypothetical protein